MLRGTKIAEGRMAEIFEWEEGWVLKLFYPQWQRDVAAYEAHQTHQVHTVGFDAPCIGKLVEIDGRFGFVLEHIHGEPMLATLQKKIWRVWDYARLMATMHANMHTKKAPNFESVHQRLQKRIQQNNALSQKTKKATLELLARLPDGDTLYHGDFHMNNIILSSTGTRVIDWIDVGRAHPLADVARTKILLTARQISREKPTHILIALLRHIFTKTYLDHYFCLTNASRSLYECWLIPLAAARLWEEIPSEQETLLTWIEEGLSAHSPGKNNTRGSYTL
jgi:uncharacterized protein (TIGR02172 family)